MSTRTLTPSAALDLLTNGVLVLTPGASAATALRHAFNRRQIAAGHTLWAPPNLLSWQQWLSTLWTSLLVAGHEERLLLNFAQEQSVWRDIVSADPTTDPLTPPDSLASLAQSSFALAAAWRVTNRLRPSASSQDTRTFAGWVDSFQRHTGRKRWLAASLLEYSLAAHLDTSALQTPASLHLLGFSTYTPSQTAFLDALHRAGTTTTSYTLVADPILPTGGGKRVAVRESIVLPDPTAELNFAARYAGHFLEDHPGATVALIFPDLAAELPALESVLRDQLAPHLNDIGANPAAAPWTSTVGITLASTPLVGPFLDLARWLYAPLAIERISTLLVSPFFGGSSTLAERSRFDACALRRELLLRPELDLRSTLALARRKDAPASLLEFFSKLAEHSDQLASQPPRRTFADWTEWLRSLCRSAEWANPEQHKDILPTAEAFDAVLDLVATLDFSGRRLTLPELLDVVSIQAQSATVPTGSPNAPFHLTTPGEALAQTFDLAIFLRATDANLPRLARPDPLLDYGLQRQHGMPGTDHAQSLSTAREAFSQLLQSSSNILLTRAASDENGTLQTSSFPFIFDFKQLEKFDLSEKEHVPLRVDLEVVPDDAPVPELPSNEHLGGARLLQLQAACGFLAFAELRLGGREIEAPEPGFDAMESGNILHRALEHFWKLVRTQDALRNLSLAERSKTVTEAIDLAVSRRLRLHDTWDGAYLAVQKDRMHRMLLRWLDFELERAPFEVLASEDKQTIQIGPLHLRLRIDRIDRLNDEGLVFVDYKTSSAAKPSAWLGDRPDEPQLPLYALLPEPEELRGIAFAKLRAGDDMQYTGYATDSGILPAAGTKLVDLPAQVAAWRSTLAALATDFHSGITCVSPKSYAVNCKHCSQRLLCRLDLSTLLNFPAENDDG
jgi:ATP-dependent helicase/nuclease subunit B